MYNRIYLGLPHLSSLTNETMTITISSEHRSHFLNEQRTISININMARHSFEMSTITHITHSLTINANCPIYSFHHITVYDACAHVHHYIIYSLIQSHLI
jgi:hypothetical protein